MHWFRRKWLSISAGALLIAMLPFVIVAFEIGGRPVEGTAGLIQQHQMIVGAFQLVLGFAIAVATLQSVKQNAEAQRRLRNRELEDQYRERVGLVNALVGAAIDASSYGSVLATLQRRGLSWKRWPDPGASRDLALATWNQLSASVAAAAKALERIRYSEDDLLEPASHLFDVVLTVQSLASEGRDRELLARAESIRNSHSELRDLVRMHRDRLYETLT